MPEYNLFNLQPFYLQKNPFPIGEGFRKVKLNIPLVTFSYLESK